MTWASGPTASTPASTIWNAAYDTALAQQAGHRTSAVDAAGVPARTPYRSDVHHQARARFLSAVRYVKSASPVRPRRLSERGAVVSAVGKNHGSGGRR